MDDLKYRRHKTAVLDSELETDELEIKFDNSGAALEDFYGEAGIGDYFGD